MSDRYEQKENSGHLFRNERKEKDTHPDFTGDCTVNGKKMKVSAWTKEIKNGDRAGQKFLSLNFSEPWKPAPKQGAFRKNDEEVF
jgi:hypothetical protein